jgi:hypothetical protein
MSTKEARSWRPAEPGRRRRKYPMQFASTSRHLIPPAVAKRKMTGIVADRAAAEGGSRRIRLAAICSIRPQNEHETCDFGHSAENSIARKSTHSASPQIFLKEMTIQSRGPLMGASHDLFSQYCQQTASSAHGRWGHSCVLLLGTAGLVVCQPSGIWNAVLHALKSQ